MAEYYIWRLCGIGHYIPLRISIVCGVVRWYALHNEKPQDAHYIEGLGGKTNGLSAKPLIACICILIVQTFLDAGKPPSRFRSEIAMQRFALYGR